MTLVNNDYLLKSNSFICQIKPDDDGCFVTLVNRNHKSLISEEFCFLGIDKATIPQIFDFLGTDSSIVEEFEKDKENYCEDYEVVEEFNDIVNMKHNKYEIGSILKDEEANRYLITYKIYDYKNKLSDEKYLRTSGQLMITKQYEPQIFHTLEKIPTTSEQKEYLINHYMSLSQEYFYSKPECTDCSKITKDFLINAIEMPDTVYIMDDFKKYSQSDFDTFKEDLIKYNIKRYFADSCASNLPEKIEDMQGKYLINTPGLLLRFNDRSLFFPNEVEKEFETFKFSNKDLHNGSTAETPTGKKDISILKNNDDHLL